jgi:hypothetical protein
MRLGGGGGNQTMVSLHRLKVEAGLAFGISDTLVRWCPASGRRWIGPKQRVEISIAGDG